MFAGTQAVTMSIRKRLLAPSAFLLAHLKGCEPAVCPLFPTCESAHPTQDSFCMTKTSKTASSLGGTTSVIMLGFSPTPANFIAGAQRLGFCPTHLMFL